MTLPADGNELTNVVNDSVREANKTLAMNSSEITNVVKDSAESIKPSRLSPKVNEGNLDDLLFLPLPGDQPEWKASSL